jgi:hypothetical protein
MTLKSLLEFKYPTNTVTEATSVDERDYHRHGKCKTEIKIQYEYRKEEFTLCKWNVSTLGFT